MSSRGSGGAPSDRARSPLAPARRALLAAALVLALAGAGCQSDPARAPERGGGTPFPELADLQKVVNGTRAILPRVPAGGKVPAPPAGALPEARSPRLVLVGKGRLLRPSAFPGLPQRLAVEVFLDDGTPPGGHLRISDETGRRDRWPILTAYAVGNREEAFSLHLRITDPAQRLRYFSLVGLIYERGGRRLRSFEGYLVFPGPGGAPSARSAVYPIDFGYQHPEPPAVVTDAGLLARRIAALRTLHRQWEALGKHQHELEVAVARLRAAEVPEAQAAKRRGDLEDFARRIERARRERRQAFEKLRADLVAIYRRRAQLAEAWRAFTDSNPYRWRTPHLRRRAYLPLQALRASYPTLETIHAALGGDDYPALRQARSAMEGALLAEEAFIPGPGD